MSTLPNEEYINSTWLVHGLTLVQFSLSVVIRDVNKMMSFAAARKNLDYKSDVESRVKENLKVMGDPGRLRQILTNLLTNSIKFTSSGSVRLSVQLISEEQDVVTVLATPNGCDGTPEQHVSGANLAL